MAVQTFNERSLDTAAFAAESVLPEENSFTVLSSEILLKGEYIRDGDDLIIRGALGEEIRVEEYFTGDNPPTLETPYGAIVLPETVQKLLVNVDPVEVAGPAGTLSIPGLLGDPIGTIDELGGEGQATAKGADGIVRTLHEGDPIYQDDVIETIGRSFANLRMMDDTSFQLGKETRAIIENYNYTPGVESGSFEATVISGFFRYASGKLGGLDKGTHTTIKTPTAQIGVRGSEMEGIVEEDGSSTFVHKDGILDVSDANGRGTVTLDEPGMATAVSTRPGAPAAAFEAPESLTRIFEEALPPPPDFVVSHDEEEAEQEGEAELLGQQALPGEEGAEEGAEEVAGEELFFVPPAPLQQEEEKAEADVEQNAVPQAVNDLLFGAEDSVISGSLAINDQMGDGRHTWRIADKPQHGTLEITPDGRFTYTPEANYNGSDSFSYIMRDADGDESTAQVFINLDAVNDQPEVVIDGILLYKEGDVLGGQGTLSVSEVDGDQIQSATITINNALASDRLVFDQPGSGISGSYSFVNGVGTLILSGPGSLEAFQNALLAVVFKSESGDPTQNGATPDRSITWSITDVTGLSSEPVSSTISITPVNNRPVVTPEGANASLTYTEGEMSSQPLFAGMKIAPVEAGQVIEELVFVVENVADGSHEKLVIDGKEIPLDGTPPNNAGNIGSDIQYKVTVDGVVTVTLTGEWDGARASQLVGGVKYANTSQDPSVEVDRVITLQSIQDSGGTDNGGVDTFANTNISTTVKVEAVNTPPTLTPTGDITSQIPYDEGAAAVDLFPSSDVQFAVDAIEEGQKLNKLVLRIENAVPDDELVIEGTTIDTYTDAPGVVTVAAANGLPQYGYSVSVVSGATAKTVDVTLVGEWSTADVQNLINALQYQNSGNDPAAWGHAERVISLHSLSDDGATPTNSADPAGSMADDATNLFSNLSRTVDIAPVNQLPTSQGGKAQLVDFKGSTALSLFSGVTVDPVEHSQTITQITLSATALSGDAGEILTINGVSISLVPTSQTTVDGLTYKVSSSVVSAAAPKGKTIITLTGEWDSDAASALVNGITYSNSADEVLADSRIIRLEGMWDSQMDVTKNGISFDNVLAEVRSPLNQSPELTVISGDPAVDVLFYEDANGGGAAVQVFSGLTFQSTAGLNEDPVQKLRLIEFEIKGVATDDYLVIGGKEILLSGANKTSVTDQSSGPPFEYSILKTHDVDGAHNGWRVTLEGRWTSDPDNNVDEVNDLLQGVYFKNSGNDPAPVGGSASRIFTLTKIWDAGDDPATTDDETGKDESLNIVREVMIDPYNQTPSLFIETTVGSPAVPAVYTVSGVEMGLFALKAGSGASAVEGSQSITSLTFRVEGIGGILSGQDGSKEWISVDGNRILLTTTAGDVAVDWSGASNAVTGSYSVTASGTDSRVVTLNGSWTPAEIDALVEGMSFGLAYGDNGQIQGSGVRTVTLTEIQDDGGTESGASNDTATLDVVAAVEVMVAADGGVSIVNKNYEVVNSVLKDLPTTAEQYFQYSEASGNAALLGGAESFEINIRLNGAGTEALLPGNAFDLFEYKTATGWVKLKIDAFGTFNLVFDKGIEEANKSPTTATLLSQTDLSSILLDGQAHDLKLTWEYGSNNAPGDFKFYLDDVTTPKVTVSETELTEGADNFLEIGGTLTIGAPSFSGTIYDVSIKSAAGTETREAHWDMDQIDSVANVIKNVLDESQYALSITNTTVTDADSTNDNAVLVDTFLITEDIDIPELKYLVDNHSFDQVTNLQLNLTGNGAEAQVLNGQDLLDLKAGGTTAPEIGTVRVFGDAEDTLMLDAGWEKQTTETGQPDHYVFTSGSDQIDLYVESVTVTQLTS